MKKVKIMLSAVAVMAIVGGSLAFKAKKAPLPLRCLYTSASQSPACPFVAKTRVITTTTGANVFATTTPTVLQNGIETCSILNTPCNVTKTSIEQ